MTTRPYRILVTGSRRWPTPDTIHTALADTVRDIPADRELVIVHGGAWGADQIADDWARAYGATVEAHPANWDKHRRAAGMIRNRDMVNLGADVALAFIHNASRGATHCAHIAEQAGIETRRYTA